MSFTRPLLGAAIALNLLACSSCGGPSGQAGPPAPPSGPTAAPAPSNDFTQAPPAVAAPRGSSSTVFAGPAAATPTGPCVAKEGRKTFDVGDDKEFKSISAVPWLRVGRGDAVRVFWRPQPYKEKFAINAAGTEKDPVRICGMPGPKGEKPIIDGENAVTAKGGSYNHAVHEKRGIVTVTAAKVANDSEREIKPRYVIVEGFEIKNAGDQTKYTNSAGASDYYFDNGACIFVERGEDILLRNNDVHHCANGIFVASGGGEDDVSRRITIEGNYLHDNGSTGSRRDRHHNAYTEALGIVYQFNRFGPIRTGSDGIQLKDRSTGSVIRYNWFEGGKRVLDLVEPEESYEMARRQPDHNKTFAYGNTIVLGKDAASRMIHYGADNDPSESRKGTLFFYDNTVVIGTSSKEQWNIALFQLETENETVDVRNNVFHSTSDANLWWVYHPGTVKLGTNWITGTVKLAREAGSPAKLEHVYGSDKTVRGAGPGFVKPDDFCLAKGAPARGAGGDLAPLPPELLPTLQYKKHQAQAPRPANKDLGAFVCD